MKRCNPLLLVASLVVSNLLWMSAYGFGQANVNENLETNFLYVDTYKGSDSNPGTQQLPLKTIGAAASLAVYVNHQNIGTRITINPGVYRESISLTHISTDTSLPITFQAAKTGTVFVSGAVQYSGWQTDSNNSEVYLHSWPNQWGLCPITFGSGRWHQYGPLQQDIVRRQEMVFVNGTPLTQVLAPVQMQPGTFYVDETTQLVYIWPAVGTDMNTADVEVSTLPALFTLQGKSNIVVRGITFEYANSCRENSAVNIAGESQNVLLDTDNFLWNNAGGLYVGNPGTANFTVQNSVANHNGQSGFGSGESKSGLWQSVVSSYNNWRGAQGAYYAWDVSGGHFYSPHNDTISNYVSAYNQTHGVHWDTDVANIKASNIISTQNLLDGVFFEVSEGPFSVTHSTVCNNNLGVHDNYRQAGGLEMRDSEQISFTDSTLYNNGAAEINLQGTPGGFTITNWETGQQYTLVNQQLTHTNNLIAAVGSGQQVFFDGYLGGSDWTQFQSTLVSNNNTWWNASNAAAFQVPSPKLWTLDLLSAWQTLTGQDFSSKWTGFSSSQISACSVAVDAPDYWIIADSASHTISASKAVLTAALVPIGTFAGNVTLTFDGVSEVPGLSAKLSTTSIAVPGSATLTVTAATNTAPGTYPITVVATSAGKTHTMTTSLVVP